MKKPLKYIYILATTSKVTNVEANLENEVDQQYVLEGIPLIDKENQLKYIVRKIKQIHNT